MGNWKLKSSLEAWEHIECKIKDELNEKGFTPKFIASLLLAMDEAFANISMYAYSEKGGNVVVESSYGIIDNIKIAQITFWDYGIQFNPSTEYIEPDIHEKNASERKIGGLGIFLIKKNVDEIKYTYEKGTNILKLIKKENINSEDNYGNNKN